MDQAAGGRQGWWPTNSCLCIRVENGSDDIALILACKAAKRMLRTATPVLRCTQVNFRYPFLLTSLGLLTAATVAHSGALLGFIRPRQQAKMARPFLLKNILPVDVCHACTLAAPMRSTSVSLLALCLATSLTAAGEHNV